MTVLIGCLIIGTSFSDEPPGGLIKCTKISVVYPQYSRVAETFDVECPVCDLTSVRKVYDSEGRLLGTLYSYELGSEPIVDQQVSCQESNDKFSNCTQTTIQVQNSGCSEHFVPCSVEDDPECLESR